MLVQFGGKPSMSKWVVSVAGRTYGPYDASQMQTFALEGRLTSESLISREGENRFAAASQDPQLGHLFQSPPAASPLSKPKTTTSKPRTFGQNESTETAEPSHFLIVADMKSGSITNLEDEIFRVGPAYAVMPQVWILSCPLSVSVLRNILIQKLGKLDTLVVVDATNDKISWSNLGLEAETKVRRLWTKQSELTAA